MQKLMFKGLMKDDKTLRELKVNNGAKLMLVGSTITDVLEVTKPVPKTAAQEKEEKGRILAQNYWLWFVQVNQVFIILVNINPPTALSHFDHFGLCLHFLFFVLFFVLPLFSTLFYVKLCLSKQAAHK